ncbi:MAG: hypothetical protein ACK53E_06795, partial [Pseudanabaena sp.]
SLWRLKVFTRSDTSTPTDLIANLPNIKLRSRFTTHKTRSLIYPHQTAIAPHHAQKPSAYFPTKQRSPLITHKIRSPIPRPNSDRLFIVIVD